MGILDRLLGRRSQRKGDRYDGQTAQAMVPRQAVQPDLVPEPDAASTPRPAGRVPEPGATIAETAVTQDSGEARPASSLPLRSLTQYQRDPAFKNFQDRLKRPPGAQRRRRLPTANDPPPNMPDP